MPGKPEQWATRVAFLMLGFAMSAWAPLVPLAKARAQLSDAELGLLLLMLGTGSIIAMPVSGWLAGAFGCRRVIVAATALVCLALPCLANFNDARSLAIALFVFGAALGANDCVINVQAVIVERVSGRTLMSGFHGAFSLGGMIGAAGISALLAAGLTPLATAVLAIAIVASALIVAAPNLLSDASEEPVPVFAIPRGAVLAIGIVCFVVFLTEGAMLDWSAVFLHDVRGASAASAGIAYALFSATMTLGRFTGDAIVAALGRVPVIAIGASVAAGGLAMAMLAPSVPLSLAGFALVGVGCSNIVPVMFSLIGRQTDMPERVAVPAVASLGYAGVLLGPAAIGFIAHHSSLVIALMCVTAALFAVAASAGRFRQ